MFVHAHFCLKPAEYNVQDSRDAQTRGPNGVYRSPHNKSSLLSSSCCVFRWCFVQCAWEKLAWPSKKNLLSEYIDMLRRITQLCSWSEDLVTPQCVWLPGLFNPTAYLTAVMQVNQPHYSMLFKPKECEKRYFLLHIRSGYHPFSSRDFCRKSLSIV